MADFDAIVIGAGCAGSVAAYELARAGRSVLMIERGNFAGAKNMTGGRIYTHALKEVFPDFEESAPLERRVTRERISMMTQGSDFSVEFTSDEMRESGKDSYTVLRGVFDQWLAEKAEEAGAEAIYGIAVESLLKDETGRITGVRAGEDEITADVVLLCDGVNSLLTQEAVGYARPTADKLAVGVKHVYQLDEKTINDRALCASGEGMAWLFAGSPSNGGVGGGLMYTNKDTVSIGLICTIEGLTHGDTPIYQLFDNFLKHPSVAPIIEGGTLVEHSGHMVPEGGFKMMPDLVGDGVMLAGDSAMMCINLGYMVRGMDYAIAAGMHAGRSAAAALEDGDTSKQSLNRYVDALENSFVLKDLRQFQEFPHFMESTTRIFNEYPEMVRGAMNQMFIVDGSPVQPMRKTMPPHIKQVGYLNLLKDVRGAMKAL